jgi:hypothetical protein
MTCHRLRQFYEPVEDLARMAVHVRPQLFCCGEKVGVYNLCFPTTFKVTLPLSDKSPHGKSTGYVLITG